MPVGVIVGVFVGVFVGVTVGVFVGVLVGVRVGVCVGVPVGVFVGVWVGVLVGVLEGVRVGVCVGVAVSVLVGVFVGVLVGVLVGVDAMQGLGFSGTAPRDQGFAAAVVQDMVTDAAPSLVLPPPRTAPPVVPVPVFHCSDCPAPAVCETASPLAASVSMTSCPPTPATTTEGVVLVPLLDA